SRSGDSPASASAWSIVSTHLIFNLAWFRFPAMAAISQLRSPCRFSPMPRTAIRDRLFPPLMRTELPGAGSYPDRGRTMINAVGSTQRATGQTRRGLWSALADFFAVCKQVLLGAPKRRVLFGAVKRCIIAIHGVGDPEPGQIRTKLAPRANMPAFLARA